MASPDKQVVPTIKQLSALGAQEVTVRVGQYSPPATARGPSGDMVPVSWQAIVKHQDASKPWAVAVRDDPDEAFRDACILFTTMIGKPMKRLSVPEPEDEDGMDLV